MPHRNVARPPGFSSGIFALTEFLTGRRAAVSQPGEMVDVVMVVRFADFDKVICALGHGHALALIHSFAEKLAEHLRDKDVISILGERDIGLVLPGLVNRSVTLLAINKIKRLLDDCMIDVRPVHSARTHVGVTLVTGDDLDPYEFIRHAYIAMLKAEKENIQFVEYTGDETQALRRELEIEEELDACDGEFPFQLHFQPQMLLDSGVVTSAEVLLRWNSPRLGYIPPNVFVQIAERKDMIDEVTEWVIHKAFQFLDGLLRRYPGFNLAINISPVNLRDSAFAPFVAECLSIWNVPPSAITLELTEGAMISDPAQAHEMLVSLKALGVKLSIDDFGTGYSSLQYLSRLPVDEVKIDQSFIRTMESDRRNRSIVDTVVDLARHFSLETVAEGIEDQEAFSYLRDIGCHKAQGYFISRPAAEADFLAFLHASGGRGEHDAETT